MAPRISVCIATYRRPERLRLVLGDLLAQSLPPQQVVVVDNHAEGSARDTVETFARDNRHIDVAFEVQPERNIALTRNRTVALADGEWLAFIDDDERAPAGWLEHLMAATLAHSADGMLAPVVPQLPSDAPRWLHRGGFYDFARMKSGTPVPPNQLRFGNIILRGSLVRAEPGPFNIAYGLTTGEDGDMLLRLIARGGKILWCDDAIVYEPIESMRLSLAWLLQRAYSGGQEFSRKTLAGRYGAINPAGRARFFLDGLLKLIVGGLLCPLTFPLGRHRSAQWLIRASANLGKLTAFLGWNYQEYASASVSKKN